MKTPSLRIAILAVAAGFGAIGPANANTIVTNFGTAPLYSWTTSWPVYGSGVSACCGVEQAMPFTTAGFWTLTQIDVALEHAFGTNSAVLTLNSDNNGVPGAVLASWNLSGLPAYGSCCTVETVTPSSPISLDSGTQYWLVAIASSSNTGDIWGWNNTGAIGASLSTNSAGGWSSNGASTLGAFDVQGDLAAPEPFSWILVAFGVGALRGLHVVKARRSR